MEYIMPELQPIATNDLFTEKYRPKSLDEYVITNDKIATLITTVQKNPSKIPHTILHSSAGTGKTTLVRAIINDLKCDYLSINASDNRGIDVVRNTIVPFVKCKAWNANVPKIIHLEEASLLTNEAQNALKQIIEDGTSLCRFIFTCNDIGAIIEPIQSRCVIYNMGVLNPNVIRNRLRYIRDEENIDSLTDEQIEALIDVYYPDMRSMIVAMDNYATCGVLDVESTIKIASELHAAILANDLTNVLAVAGRRDIEHRTILRMIYRKLITDESIRKVDKREYIRIICEGDYRMAVGAQKEIAFMDTMTSLAMHLRK